MRRWAWFLVIVAAILTRLWGWPDNPSGFNQDEASIGYEAYALLNYGIDRHGYAWPVHLVSWGSGQHILYAWLTMPFIAWFGLTEWAVRLPMLIVGVLSVPLFAAVVRRVLPTDPVSASRSAAWAAWLLALSPWHILMSRWALESNLLPFVWLCAIYSWIRWCEKPNWTWSLTSAAAFAACMYTYSSAYWMVPLMIAGGLIYVGYIKRFNWAGTLRFIPVFLLLSAPIIWFILINRFKWPEFRSDWLSIPRLPAMERYIERSIFHTNDWLAAAGDHFGDTLRILLWQSDGQVWNGLPLYAIWFMIALPFLLWGLIRTAVDSWRSGNRLGQYGIFLLLWLGGALLIGVFADPNVNRLNLIFMPLIALTAFGIVEFTHSSKRRIRYTSRVIAGASMLAAVAVLPHILYVWPQEVGKEFYQGIGQAVRTADARSAEWAINGHKLPIVYDGSVRFSQIYTMFYLKLQPAPYAEALQSGTRKRADFPTNYEQRYWFEGGPQRHAVLVSRGQSGAYAVEKME